MFVLLVEGTLGTTRGGWCRWGSCRVCLRSVPALLSPLCPGWRCCNASHSAVCSIWGFSKGSVTPKWPKIRVFLVGLASGSCRCSWLCGLQHIPSLSKQKRPALGTAALVTWCLESNSFFFFFLFFFDLNTVGTLRQHNPTHVRALLPPPGPAVPRELGAATLRRPGLGCGSRGCSCAAHSL